jgi:trimeric autotransporter adhesin
MSETEPEATTVEVPGQDTTVIVEPDGTAAAVAVNAADAADAATEAAETAAATAAAAAEHADAAQSETLTQAQELKAMRAEFGEVRGFISELAQERAAAREAAQAAADDAASVKEVPVNDAAARDAAKRAESDSDPGQTSGGTKAATSTDKSTTGESAKPAKSWGSRRRNR